MTYVARAFGPWGETSRTFDSQEAAIDWAESVIYTTDETEMTGRYAVIDEVPA